MSVKAVVVGVDLILERWGLRRAPVKTTCDMARGDFNLRTMFLQLPCKRILSIVKIILQQYKFVLFATLKPLQDASRLT